MPGHTLKSLVSRRRRANNDGEDEEESVVVADSQSEGSVITELESDDGDMDESIEGEQPGTAQTTTETASDRKDLKRDGQEGKKSGAKKRKQKKKPVKVPSSKDPTPNGSAQSSFRTTVDTDAMMNGLKANDPAQGEAEVLDFESKEGTNGGRKGQNGNAANVGDPRRREHQEYRKQRDSNPAFIPNRGGFYMHDSRSPADSRGPITGRPLPQGRGKGRGGPVQAVGGKDSPLGQQMPTNKVSEGPWKHDLHDTINEEPPATAKNAEQFQDHADESARLFGKPAAAQDRQGAPPVISFSSTTLVGKVNLRVLLPGMQAAITYAEVPVKHYTRLPNHRPPLRRDKPVRISLPDNPPRYIFPSPDRSFIFIPRQMRPNQQGFGRYAQHSRSIGGYGYSSRRTSMYGGSVYSASIAPSRRPSMVSQIGRDPVFSPAASVASGFQPNPFRPVVRMPPNLHAQSIYSGTTTPAQHFSGYHTPTMPPMQNYPPPGQPTYQGTPTTNVQHPRPQKAISVSGIDSPALVQQSSSVPPDSQQPFHNQLPAHMQHDSASSFGLPTSQPFYNPGQQFNYSQSSHVNTPSMGGIPENAIHAPPFQAPAGLPYGQAFYPQFPNASAQGQGGYGYWPPQPGSFAPMPVYQASRDMATAQPQQEMQPRAAQRGDTSQTADGQQFPPSQSGFVAYEERGMVFYRPASEAQQQGQEGSSYQPAETFTPAYAMPPGGNMHPAQQDTPFFAYQDMTGMFYPPMALDMAGQGQQ